MVPNINELYRLLEEKLNVRDASILKYEELIKDVSDFELLLPELNQIIIDLEKKYSETKDINVREELNSYLKERKDYWELIQSFRSQANQLEKDMKEEDKLVFDFYKRREILSYLREIEKSADSLESELVTVIENEENEMRRIPISKIELYEQYKRNLNSIDDAILKCYWNTSLKNMNQTFDYESISFEPPVVFRDYEKEELLQKKEQLLMDKEKLDMEIKKERGKKQTFLYSYHGEEIRVNIPKKLIGKYKRLIYELKQVEELQEKYYPPVVFETQLYESMTESQKRAYLANLMLQIEVRANRPCERCYVHGKYIPAEYKKLYEKITQLLKYNSKQIRQYSVPIDWRYVEDVSVQERKDYFKGLMQQYLNSSTEDIQILSYGDTKYYVSKDDVPAFKTCYEEYFKASKELAEEEPLNIKNRDFDKLNIEEIKKHYISLMEEICSRDIQKPFVYSVNGKEYTLDEKYKEEFLQIVETYANTVNPRNIVIAKKVYRPKFLDSFKKKLKKIIVPILLATASYSYLIGFGFKKDGKEEISVQSEIEDLNALNNLSLDSINTIQDIPFTSNETQENALEESSESSFSQQKIQDWTEATTFQLAPESSTFIYQSDSNIPLQPKYPNDEYRIVFRNYEMPDGVEVKISMEDENAQQKITQIELAGGILNSVDAVAKTGEEDYAIHKIPTGTFQMGESLIPNYEYTQGRGR